MSKNDEIVVVSGLPRSGTSLMMQILDKGGIKAWSDGEREPDQSNPKGYYEHEKVKALMKDNSFLSDTKGHAIKIISQLLPSLDNALSYRVIVMDRSIDEVLRSQQVMLGKDPEAIPPPLKDIFSKQFKGGINFLEENNIPHIIVKHREIIEDPAGKVKEIKEFCNLDVPEEELASVVDKKLHRQKV